MKQINYYSNILELSYHKLNIKDIRVFQTEFITQAELILDPFGYLDSIITHAKYSANIDCTNENISYMSSYIDKDNWVYEKNLSPLHYEVPVEHMNIIRKIIKDKLKSEAKEESARKIDFEEYINE